MRLDIVDAVSEAEPRRGRVSEDLYGASASAVWILDGATGLADERVLPGPSDARWLVDLVDAVLRQESNPTVPLPDLFRRIAREAMTAFAAAALRPDAPAMDMPCACLAFVRVSGNRLELANIGDCRILHRRPDGSVSRFGTSHLTALDEGARQEVVRLQADGFRHDEVWPALLPRLRRNRGSMNEPGGYWILDPSERWVEHVETATLAGASGDHLLLATDGFWRLVDTYARYDQESLLAAALSRGLPSLARELRTIEDADEECRRYPRLKARDDATAVLVQIAEES